MLMISFAVDINIHFNAWSKYGLINFFFCANVYFWTASDVKELNQFAGVYAAKSSKISFNQ